MTLPAINQDSPLDIADSVLPIFGHASDKKREYLSYRLCGFGRTEACRYAGVDLNTVKQWVKRDKRFAAIEKENLLELRNKFAKDITAYEFTRNFRLALANDARVLDKVKRVGINKLTKSETDYFLKIRQTYTPQQLSVLEQLLDGSLGKDDFDWTMMVKGRGPFPGAPRMLEGDSDGS